MVCDNMSSRSKRKRKDSEEENDFQPEVSQLAIHI